jgi:hypothetical protein
MIKIIPLVIGSIFGAGAIDISRKHLNHTLTARLRKDETEQRNKSRATTRAGYWAG